MRSYRSRLLLFLVLLVAVCASAVEKITDLRPTVILVSIDAFRPDYLDKIPTPNLHSLIARGTRAKYMIPSFPTKTFPNHYTIVTGLYPAHHGIVANNMWDPDMNAKFSMSLRDAVNDARWWGGEPIWVTAEKQGVRTAPFLWPGSSANEKGITPTYTQPWHDNIPTAERLKVIFEALDKPVAGRPQFISLYLNMVDDEGHDFGPFSPECNNAVEAADAAVGQLLAGLRERGIEDQVNIIVVSDHGMSPTSPQRVVYLDNYITPDSVMIVDRTPVIALRPKDGDAQALYRKLAHLKHGKAYLSTNVPERWHFTGSKRITPVIVQADDGWTIDFRDYLAEHKVKGGNHGFDNKSKNMRATFIAAGPAFQKATIKPFPNVDVYSLLAYLLNLQPAKNDGTMDPFKSVLVQRSETNPSHKQLAPWQKEWDEVAIVVH